MTIIDTFDSSFEDFELLVNINFHRLIEAVIDIIIHYYQLQGKKLPLVRPSETSTLLSRTSGFAKALVLWDK